MEWKKPERSGGDREFFKIKDNEGALVGFQVKRFQANYENRFKEIKDTVWADITVFDGDNAGKEYPSTEIVATAWVSILSNRIGEGVLARITKTKNYWDLEDPTDEDFELASKGVPTAEDDDPGY